MSLLDRFGALKHALPLNGDWLFPTVTPEGESTEDLASRYSTPGAYTGQLDNLTEGQEDALDSEAGALRERVETRAEHVRDKAKVLLNTNSFIGSVALGVVSLLAAHVSSMSTWMTGGIFGGLFLMLLQFGSSLVRAMSAITREEIIDISSEDILRGATRKAHLVIAKLAAANAYQILITKKVNQLILAQTGFQWGSIYACAVILWLIMAVVSSPVKPRGESQGVGIEKIVELERSVDAMSFTLHAELSEIKALSLEQSQSLKKEIDVIGERLDKLAERVQKLQNHPVAPPIRR